MRSALLLTVLVASGLARQFAQDSQPKAADNVVAPAVSDGRKIGFKQMEASITGVNFANRLPAERYLTNQIFLNGSGVAAGDIDGDGRCDVYFCALGGTNALYRNLGGWKFEEIASAAGVALPGLDSTGVVLADLDGDGDLDLIVNTVAHETHCFLNDGKGHFTELTKDAVLNPIRCGSSMALADIDGDGDLDLYIANYRADTIRDHPRTRLQGDRIDGKLTVWRFNGRPTTEPDLVGRFTLTEGGRIIEHGEADTLLRNDGGGKLTPLAFTDGRFLDEDGKALSEPPYDWGLSVMFRDLNGDGAPDIYICNDFDSPDRIWINDGKGNFRALPRLALRHTSLFSMGVDCADLDRDGLDEVFVADMLSRRHDKRQLQVGDVMPVVAQFGKIDDRPQYSFNTLFSNRGDGTYAEIAWFGGLQASEWSWTPVFLDVDLDGYEDLLVTTGHELEMMNVDVSERIEQMKARENLSVPAQLNLRKMFPRLDSPKVAFRNRGDLTFEDASRLWGFDQPGVSHGMALADLDGDGDLDLVVNNLNGVAGMYRNESSAPRVAVRLKGLAPNTHGIGAKIWLYGGAVPMQSQEMMSGGRYLSSDEPLRVFAAGSLTNDMRIEVKWRSGRRSGLNGVQANRTYEIDEASAHESSKLKAPDSKLQTPDSDPQRSTLNDQPLFADVSSLIGHRHHEEEFNDFERQPLLLRKLSQGGPGVAWWDVDGDGQDDLIIGSGKGGQLAVYRNDGKGGFEWVKGAPVDRGVSRDQTGVVGIEGGVMIGSSNYEDGLTNGGCVRLYDLRRKLSGESILGQSFGVGPLALADLDNDGDLDLFVGGQVVAGRYPEPATSLVLRNEDGRLVTAQYLEKVGLVSGAVFSDLNGDGQPDLILACEWGPIKIFRNERGNLVPWDAPVTINHSSRRSPTKDQLSTGNQQSTLSQLTGWWNGVTTGDLDGDGRMDIVASNWGLNSRHQTSPAHPRKLYFGSLQGKGTLDLIESYYDEEMRSEVPERGLRAVGAVLPFVREKVASYERYGKASLQDIYGEKLKQMGVVEVSTLESMVFLNRGERFQARALPAEAQWAPAFAVCVGDCDGDGKEDVFLSQNFFPMNAEDSRCDAGRGLWLKGDGQGNLRAVAGQASGVKVYGEQRGAALCDYDGDGRVDLVVTQNGAETKLYHNVGGRRGLRVKLRGPAGNPQGLGAQLRLIFGQRSGPVREIHGGSGYWSQDSATAVLGSPEPPSQLQVRWPGGKTSTTSVPRGASEIEVTIPN